MVVRAIPRTNPVAANQGDVCQVPSSHIPTRRPPIVGINILHVTSAISLSNKTTVEVVFGGLGVSPGSYMLFIKISEM
jgi:hypothetical protein